MTLLTYLFLVLRNCRDHIEPQSNLLYFICGDLASLCYINILKLPKPNGSRIEGTYAKDAVEGLIWRSH